MDKQNFDVTKLSAKAQAKLEEIRQQHQLATLAEAAQYLLTVTKVK